jgi:hypothetical protein
MGDVEWEAANPGDQEITLTLTIRQARELWWTIHGSHQEFCTGDCDCYDLQDLVWSAVPEGIDP